MTFTRFLAGCTDGRWGPPPAVIVTVVLVLALAAHAGPDCVDQGILAVLAALMAESLVGRHSGDIKADQGL
ncbi:hypothetical protein AB0F36_02615 [Streptomyces sp. NPDC029080]|uniref:hypothetical protein n=1 Tax=Streptomyces sp. NPDC029080 TaxID=3155017 RepID=UPI00340EFDAF